MIRKSTSWTTLIYGLFIIILGYLGYFLAGSILSLYLGSGLGLLILLSSVLMFYQIRFASYAALFFTFVLLATFATRYSLTGKGLPALLAVISGLMLLFLLSRTIHWKH